MMFGRNIAASAFAELRDGFGCMVISCAGWWAWLFAGCERMKSMISFRGSIGNSLRKGIWQVKSVLCGSLLVSSLEGLVLGMGIKRVMRVQQLQLTTLHGSCGYIAQRARSLQRLFWEKSKLFFTSIYLDPFFFVHGLSYCAENSGKARLTTIRGTEA